jgi:ATP/maltotriose-dependent transcriptional regulator MalT
MRGNPTAAQADCERALGFAPPGSDVYVAALNNLVCGHIVVGDFDAAINLGTRAEADAAETGQVRRIAPIISNVAEALVSAGQVDAGLAAARRASALAWDDALGIVLACTQIEGTALVWGDQLEEYHALQAATAEDRPLTMFEESWLAVWSQMLCDAAVAEARDLAPAERRHALEDALPVLDVAMRDQAIDEPGQFDTFVIAGARLLAAAASAGIAVNDSVTQRLLHIADALPDEPYYAPVVALMRAHLAPVLAAEDPVERWQRAVELADTPTFPRRHGLEARYRLALALHADGRKREAVTLLRSVVDDAPPAGAHLLARWAREALDRSAPGRDDPGDLTARETEVLGLVAEGLTNTQIGERLFISPKTVSVHVSSILAKIGVANRTEAAQYFSSTALVPDRGAS